MAKQANHTAKLKVLIIGPLPPFIGGTTVLLEQLRSELNARDDVEIKAINSLGIRGKGLLGPWFFIRLFFSILKAALRSDVVSLHGSTSGLHVIGPAVLLAGTLARKPVIIRKFGGGDFSDFDFARRNIIWWVVRHIDLYLPETKHLTAVAQRAGIKHVRWYANSRPISPSSDENRDNSLAVKAQNGCKKFAFIGHVRAYKGIRELVEAAEQLDENISVDVYGPLFDDLDETLFDGRRNIRYKGVVKPENVVPTLRQYDAALLPTKAQREGYPGAVLDSYNAGIPIITTTCGAIPEIVDKSCGILVEPGNVDALYQAMRRITEDCAFYAQLLEGVKKRFGDFSSEVWTETFLLYCRELAEKRFDLKK